MQRLTTTVKFTPPPINLEHVNPVSANLRQVVREGGSISIEVKVPRPPTSPLSIQIIPRNNFISINNNSAGQTVSVQIPSSDRRAIFTVSGVVSGQSNATGFDATALGYQTSGMSITVTN